MKRSELLKLLKKHGCFTFPSTAPITISGKIPTESNSWCRVMQGKTCRNIWLKIFFGKPA